MKIKKLIVCIIIFILLWGVVLKSFATEEIQEGTIETENPPTENPTEENPTDDNNGDNEENNQGNTNTEPNSQGNNNSTGNNENGSETQTSNNENNNHSTQRDNNYYISSNNNSSTFKSSNANLKYLNVNIEGLSPEFDKNITEYYLTVDLTVENINVEALTEDINAKVTISGNDNLVEGENNIQILVVAEDGNTKTYSICATKVDDAEKINTNLKTLSVNGFSLYPAFKANIYNYSLTIDEKILQLEILAETENEEATFEVVGNENLKEGDNLIKIIVTAKDGETKREYKINTFISTENIQTKATDLKQAIIILFVLGLAIVGVSVLLWKRKS